MDEGGTGEADGVHALMLARAQKIAWLGVMRLIEWDMQRMYRGHVIRLWMMRALVLLNVVNVAWDLNDAQEWVRWCSLLPAGGAVYAFRVSERFAGDLPCMRTALADVREKIKTAMRLANES